MTDNKSRHYTGTTDPNVSERETQYRLVARRAAAEGFVLLKNEGVLPLAQPCKIALYGAGARQTVKGGTGSGDVYSRDVISIEKGLINAGYEITTSAWLNDFDRINLRAKRAWTNTLLRNVLGKNQKETITFYLGNPFQIPAGRLISPRDIKESGTDVAIYVIARISGEGSDRRDQKGDYRLADTEFANLKLISEAYKKTIVIINTGGMMDLSFLDQIPGINGLIYALQPGMEAGNALADIIKGTSNPSGKLTDSWAARYADYPASKYFSHNDGNVSEEFYVEDIFVGYRYFDRFNVKPRYEFGFGKSYTNFSIKVMKFTCEGARINITVSVTNTGIRYSGKEVVQVYVSAPQGKLAKPAQVLAAFGKTAEISPNAEQTMTLGFDLVDLASYDEERSAWILEPGIYTVATGNSSRSTTITGYLELDQEVIAATAAKICPVNKPFEKIAAPDLNLAVMDTSLPCLKVSARSFQTQKQGIENKETRQAARAIVEKLSMEELALVVCGTGQGGESLGSSSQSVPGAAGETTSRLAEKVGLAPIVLADGPAGLRLSQKYIVDADGKIHSPNLMLSILELSPVLKTILGLLGLSDIKETKGSTSYYQYCTALPIGTLLAQTWNLDLIEEVGRTVGKEMDEFEVTLWLAPGMNIHRDPLCGRNFEYYSEDPFLTGKMAAALTRGVQSLPGIGTTIKHFTCNNQEANRNFADSILSERALREIYLKGFEIAIKDSQPMAVMTSYNLVNGVRTPNSWDLCTQVLRNEWGFEGVVMTDWLATSNGMASVVSCIEAGNDLIMPGEQAEVDQLIQAARDGKLDIERLKGCAEHTINIVLKSNRYEDCQPYLGYFGFNKLCDLSDVNPNLQTVA